MHLAAAHVALARVHLDGSSQRAPKTNNVRGGRRQRWSSRGFVLSAIVVVVSSYASLRFSANDFRAYFQSTAAGKVYVTEVHSGTNGGARNNIRHRNAAASALHKPSSRTAEDAPAAAHKRKKDRGGKRLRRRAAEDRFVPSRNGTAWSLPSTAFTPHILKLVDFVQRNKRRCASPRGRLALMNVEVRSPTTVSVSLVQEGDNFIERWYKVILERKILQPQGNGRVLPVGNVTIAVSGDDRNELSDVCFFANSAPDGDHTVFNFEDVRQWAKAEKLPPPLPWDERETIPVFRGRLWGVNGRMLDAVQREIDDNPNLTIEEADRLFERKILYDGDFHRRGALVYFSKQHPELVNARIHGYGPKAADMYLQNATNGLHRIMPLHEIPAEEYYTKYQTHVVMGGAGAAFRLGSILGQTTAVVLQEYPYHEWFTHLLEPFVHYIPLDQGLSNLTETLHWVRDNPSKVHQIAKNGKSFYDKYLSFDRMGEFYHELIFRLMLCCGTQSR